MGFKTKIQAALVIGMLMALVFAFTALSLTGCSNPTGGGGGGPSGPIPKVYVAGSYNSKPCYWVNNVRVDLKVPEGAAGAEANAITVASDGTVYVAGNYWEPFQPTRACYWKGDEIENDLADSDYLIPESITVASNGKVYVTIGKSYWEDGAKQPDFTPAGSQYVSTVTVASDGSVYHAGRRDTGSAVYKACYWKDRGSLVGLSSDPSSVSYIAVVDGVIYAQGSYNPGSGNKLCSWTGAQQNPLEEPAGNDGVYIKAVTGAGGVAYVLGHYYDGPYDVPCYWKNDALKTLSLPAGAVVSKANGIAVLDGVAFVAGDYGIYPDIKACYWVGGQPVKLPQPAGAITTSANGIYVKW